MATVIDVSEHQGWIDWDETAGVIDGAIIRIGYGGDYANQDDAYATRNLDECERLGIPYGVYLYSYAHSASDVEGEISHALRMLEGRKPTLGVWFDTEESGCEGASWEASMRFCTAMDEAGYRTGVYCYQAWYWAHLSGMCDIWPIWFASYTSYPNMPGNVYAWQYSSDGDVAGVYGRVDMNEWYHDEWFDESEDEVIKDEDIARIWAYHYQNDDDEWDCYTKLRECAKHVQYHESRVEGGDGGDTRTRIDYIDERVKQIDAKLDELIEKLGE